MSETVPPATAAKVKGFNCPQCGAAVALRGFEHTLTVVCVQCLSVLDAKDPNYQVLQTFQERERIRPLIPLGSRGKLHGTVYEVIGFQERTIHVDGMPYSWHEYLLFNPFQGFRYLSQYNGHWNDINTVRSVPEPAPTGGKPGVRLLGETYRHFQSATAETTFVMGEFPWQVRVGDKAAVQDFIAPPRLLSAETTESETVWSLGEYLSGARVWDAFQLPESPPPATGVFANQPSPYPGRLRRTWVMCLILLGVLLNLAILISALAGKEEVFRQSYRHPRELGTEAAFVTSVFDLPGRPSSVELSIDTDLRNDSAYFSFALINEATGQAWDFGRQVTHSGGGKARDRALVPTVPPGRYYLRVEPELLSRSGFLNYELLLRRDVPAAAFYWIAALLLVVPPVFVGIGAVSFEKSRWQESDYGESSAASEDEEEDEE